MATMTEETCCEGKLTDNGNEEREISLFLNIKDRKVSGAETTPILLPRGWTYDILRTLVVDHVFQSLGPAENVSKLYFKRAKGKSIVCLDSDRDVPALLKEYPLEYANGKKKTGSSCLMYLAVQLEKEVEKGSDLRKSPRLKGETHYDIFVHQYTEDGKVSSTADTIHNVSSLSSLDDIIAKIVVLDSQTIYLPKRGLYWLRKGTRQTVVLKTDEDLNLCKRDYIRGAVRIACAYLDSSPDSGKSSKSKKRKLDMDAASSTDNELWNDIHISLVRDLEKKGVMWRYNIAHMKLWTDLIVDGKLCGIGEEPIWDEYLEIVKVPLKSRRVSTGSSNSSIGSSSPTSACNSPVSGSSALMEMLLLQNQQRMELESKKADMLQTTLLAMINSSNKSTTPAEVPKITRKAEELTEENVVAFLKSIGLECYIEVFQANNIDGPMLEAFVHPTLGQGIMDNLGIQKQHAQKLKTEIYRLKVEGFRAV